MSVGRSVINFPIEKKKDFESTNSNLSNTTKFNLLHLLLQEFTAWEIQIETKKEEEQTKEEEEKEEK